MRPLFEGGGYSGAALVRVNTVALRYAFTSTISYGGTVVFFCRNEIVGIPVDVNCIHEPNV